MQPFSFNRLDQLESIASKHELAAVKMEVQRTQPPDPGFLEGVRELCTRRGIVPSLMNAPRAFVKPSAACT